MHQTPRELLKKKLKRNNLTPQRFSKISGMPISEINGLLEGRLPFTILRANHLAAVFNTDTELWLNGRSRSTDAVISCE